MSEIAHTGRGGAGNVGTKSPPPPETSLHTPTIKQDHYTTGRGGQGNMARNNGGADEARAAQDVGVPLAVAKDHQLAHHVGRGGGGNVAKDAAAAVDGNGVGSNGEVKPVGARVAGEQKPRSGSRSVLDRAKETLGLKK